MKQLLIIVLILSVFIFTLQLPAMAEDGNIEDYVDEYAEVTTPAVTAPAHFLTMSCPGYETFHIEIADINKMSKRKLIELSSLLTIGRIVPGNSGADICGIAKKLLPRRFKKVKD